MFAFVGQNKQTWKARTHKACVTHCQCILFDRFGEAVQSSVVSEAEHYFTYIISFVLVKKKKKIGSELKSDLVIFIVEENKQRENKNEFLSWWSAGHFLLTAEWKKISSACDSVREIALPIETPFAYTLFRTYLPHFNRARLRGWVTAMNKECF